MDILFMLIGGALMVVGLVGAIIPAVPGIPLIFAGIWLLAWADRYQHLGLWWLLGIAVIAAIGMVIDLLSGALGAKRVAASGQAIAGAMLGTLVGLFFGLPGLLLGPFLGAVAGELAAGNSILRSAHVGVGTWIGLLFGTLVKLVASLMMVALAGAGWVYSGWHQHGETSHVPRKLHIGGQVKTPGWEVLDANPGPCVDHVADAGNLRGFADNSFAEIYASHVVEHFDYQGQLVDTLREWHRVLAPSGTLYVSVPDLDILALLFIDRPRLSAEDRFLVMRMIFGGHIDKHDYHLVGLNEEFLTGYLEAGGFTGIRRVTSFGLFQDTSSLEMKGTPISLNMIATKG